MPDRFSVTLRGASPVVVLDLVGELDGTAEQALRESYGAAVATGASKVVLDFGGTSYINSTGIALIVQLLGRARADRVALSAYGLTDHYRHIFEITRLVDFMAVHVDEASAVA